MNFDLNDALVAALTFWFLSLVVCDLDGFGVVSHKRPLVASTAYLAGEMLVDVDDGGAVLLESFLECFTRRSGVTRRC